MLLNADIGEGHDDVDRQIMPFIHQANIACGGHAGDDDSITRTVALAQKRHVLIGAHPSYPDKTNFGRRSIDLPITKLETQLLEQIQSINNACNSANAELNHIKAHGALYNDANHEPAKMQLLIELAKAFQCKLMIQCLPGQSKQTIAHANTLGVECILEGFADRAYMPNGSLAPRARPGAVFETVEYILTQATQFKRGESITCLDGKTLLKLKIDSLCVHGDNTIALKALTAIFDSFYSPS